MNSFVLMFKYIRFVINQVFVIMKLPYIDNINDIDNSDNNDKINQQLQHY